MTFFHSYQRFDEEDVQVKSSALHEKKVLLLQRFLSSSVGSRIGTVILSQ